MGRGARKVLALAIPAFAACGGPSTEAPTRGSASSAPPAASSSTALASDAFDVDAVRALLAEKAEAATRARAALVAPHPGLLAGTETLLPALGPCVRPSAAETKAMETRVLAWVERQVPSRRTVRRKTS